MPDISPSKDVAAAGNSPISPSKRVSPASVEGEEADRLEPAIAQVYMDALKFAARAMMSFLSYLLKDSLDVNIAKILLKPLLCIICFVPRFSSDEL